MNNSQVAHIWAQREAKRAKGSNFYCENDRLYSYDTCIARFYGTRAVICDKKYSHSTSRHVSLAKRARTYSMYYSTEIPIDRLPDTWADVAILIADELKDSVLVAIDLLKRGRLITYLVRSLIESCRIYSQFCKHEQITVHSSIAVDLEQLVSAFPDGDIFHNPEEFAKVINNKDTGVQACIQRLTGVDISAKLAKELEREKQAEIKREQAHQAQIALQLDNVQKWRTGEYGGSLYLLPTMLRINNYKEAIETSQGADVPIAHAKLLYKAIKSGRDLSGIRIGHFTVNSADSEHIKIGCHKIPMAEIELIASELGLTN